MARDTLSTNTKTLSKAAENQLYRDCVINSPTWDGIGINTIIPDTILQGLIGHPFVCPDMIYGGDWGAFMDGNTVDEELFIRCAQCSALLPMMQFSLSPWRALSEEALELVKDAAMLHKKFAPEIINLVKARTVSGDPIIRNLEYNYPI